MQNCITASLQNKSGKKKNVDGGSTFFFVLLSPKQCLSGINSMDSLDTVAG